LVTDKVRITNKNEYYESVFANAVFAVAGCLFFI
jgi:hypothetical protein